MKQYKILSDTTIEKLQMQVEDHIAQGWTIQAGVVTFGKKLLQVVTK